MKTKQTWILISAIAIASLSLIVDSSWYKMPEWLTYVIAGVVVVMVGIFSYINRSTLWGNRNSIRK